MTQKVVDIVIPWDEEDVQDHPFISATVSLTVGKVSYAGRVVSVKTTADDTTISVEVNE